MMVAEKGGGMVPTLIKRKPNFPYMGRPLVIYDFATDPF
jgi:hypothetical protein